MSDMARRKALLRQWKQAEQARERALFPLPDATLRGFFEQLETALQDAGCQHDTRLAQAVIDGLQLADPLANALLDWCADNGGFCDCEIAGNAQQHWLENRAPP